MVLLFKGGNALNLDCYAYLEVGDEILKDPDKTKVFSVRAVAPGEVAKYNLIQMKMPTKQMDEKKIAWYSEKMTECLWDLVHEINVQWSSGANNFLLKSNEEIKEDLKSRTQAQTS